MIWNAFSVLDGVVAALRWGLAVWAAAETILLMSSSSAKHADGQQWVALRGQRLLLVCGTLGVLSLAAWPVFYLLLESYVPRYPGVMCVFGVSQVGHGSAGATRFLPWLVASVEWLRPLSLFAAGAWGALHLVDRQRATPGGSRSVLVAALCMATLTAADSSAELAYLVIPKREKKLAVGCCQLKPATQVADSQKPAFESARLLGGGAGVAGLVVSGGLLPVLFRLRWAQSRCYWLALTATALVWSWLSWDFWVHHASYILLQPANHACGYCLFARFPALLAAFVLLFLAAACLGWGALIQLVFARGELREVAARLGRNLAEAGLLCLVSHFLLASIPLGPLF